MRFQTSSGVRETFDTQGQRVLVSVHHMHILHGCSEAALLFWTEPLKLEQRCIIVKHPNISFESSFVQDNTIHNMLELIPTRIWMLASLQAWEIEQMIASLFPSAQVCTSWWLTKAVSASSEFGGTKVLDSSSWRRGNGRPERTSSVRYLRPMRFDFGQVTCQRSLEPSARTT